MTYNKTTFKNDWRYLPVGDNMNIFEEQSLDKDSEEDSLIDKLDAHYHDEDPIADKREQQLDLIRSVISTLNPKEQTIVEAYMIHGKTYQQIGQELYDGRTVTKQYIYQLIKKVKTKLRIALGLESNSK